MNVLDSFSRDGREYKKILSAEGEIHNSAIFGWKDVAWASTQLL